MPACCQTFTAKKKTVFVDAFAGCGGLSLGLFQAGLSGLFAIEHDKFAFETLRTNFLAGTAKHNFDWPKWLPQAPISIGSLLKEYASHLKSLRGSIDLLVGGPPCQGFSSAGRRKHDDPRNALVADYLKVVDLLRPRALLIENVRGFTMDFNKEARIQNYATYVRQALSPQFKVYDQLLDLSQFGVPQSRTRYFLVALQPGLCDDNPFDLLKTRLPSYLRSLGIQAPVSSWSAISDLEISRGGRRPSSDSPGFDEINYTAPKTRFQKLMRDGAKRPTDLRLARHSAKIVKRFAEIIELSHAEGRLNTSISDDVRTRYGMRKMALRVLDPDRPSPTVTSMPDDLLHYSEPRTLTVRENARLQSFPDSFSFSGKYTTGGHLRRREVPRFTQVANAVPPLFARAIGELLIEVLSRTEDHSRVLTSTPGLQRRQQHPEVAAQL
jgi:DNA (cytosine-5)-methyltransferase 1